MAQHKQNLIDAAEALDLDPNDLLQSKISGACPSHGVYGACPEDGAEYVLELADPGPNRTGEIPHAYPEQIAEYSTCRTCGAEVFYDDTDDEGTGIWTHTATLDYFCEED